MLLKLNISFVSVNSHGIFPYRPLCVAFPGLPLDVDFPDLVDRVDLREDADRADFPDLTEISSISTLFPSQAGHVLTTFCFGILRKILKLYMHGVVVSIN